MLGNNSYNLEMANAGGADLAIAVLSGIGT